MLSRCFFSVTDFGLFWFAEMLGVSSLKKHSVIESHDLLLLLFAFQYRTFIRICRIKPSSWSVSTSTSRPKVWLYTIMPCMRICFSNFFNSLFGVHLTSWTVSNMWPSFLNFSIYAPTRSSIRNKICSGTNWDSVKQWIQVIVEAPRTSPPVLVDTIIWLEMTRLCYETE